MCTLNYSYTKERFLKNQKDTITQRTDLIAEQRRKLLGKSLKTIGAFVATGLALTALVASQSALFFNLHAEEAACAGLVGIFMGTCSLVRGLSGRWKGEIKEPQDYAIRLQEKTNLANWLDRLQQQGKIGYIEGLEKDGTWVPLSPFGYAVNTANDKKLSPFVPRSVDKDAVFDLLSDDISFDQASYHFNALYEQVEKGSLKKRDLPCAFLDRLIEEGLVYPNPTTAQASLRRQRSYALQANAA